MVLPVVVGPEKVVPPMRPPPPPPLPAPSQPPEVEQAVAVCPAAKPGEPAVVPDTLVAIGEIAVAP